MTIQWFPGHMHKAQKEIRALLPDIDVLVEVLDARIPFSSENPMLASIRGNKPCIKLLHKSDLADTQMTHQWIRHFDSEPVSNEAFNDQSGHNAEDVSRHTVTLSTKRENCQQLKSLPTLAHELNPNKTANRRGTRVLVVGIPNVGKSTVINLLAGRAIAKTGNEPAVTRRQQKIDIGHGVVLFDTPGVLWPNLEHPKIGLRLATLGSVKDTAMDYTEVALFAASYMLGAYPPVLRERYPGPAKLALRLLAGDGPEPQDEPLDESLHPAILEQAELAFLHQLGLESGCLERGGQIDYDRAARVLINDIRSGMLGALCLESPDTKLEDLRELELIREKKAEREKLRSKKRKKR